MDEKQYFVAICKIIAVSFCALVIAGAGCTANRHYQTRVLIENANVSPIGAKCAIDGDSGSVPICIIEAAKNK